MLIAHSQPDDSLMALVVALCVINVFAIGILIDVGLYNMIDCGSAVLCCSYLYSSRAPTLYSTPIGEAPPSTAARALDEHVPLTTYNTNPSIIIAFSTTTTPSTMYMS